MKGSHPLEDAG